MSLPPTVSLPNSDFSRRRYLQWLGVLGVSLSSSRGHAQVLSNPTFRADPFSLGLASGAPYQDSVVLWTRLAPAPLEPGGGMPEQRVLVTWELASDDRMRRIVQRGTTVAEPAWAHSLHVEVEGLEPDRPYWFRFRTGRYASKIGSTRTFPALSSSARSLRLVYASCQQYEQGYFSAYRGIVRDEPQLVVHLGDYIYESSWGTRRVRRHGTPEPVTLDDYRARHALYKTDPDLQAAHAACPWLVTWDDHEVENDYADDRSERLDDPTWFLARRAAAYKAYYEHMPLRRRQIPLGDRLNLYERLLFGDLVTFHKLDGRQYRSPQPCPRPGRGGSNEVPGDSCTERTRPEATYLGDRQERWLTAGFSTSRSRWNIVAQQTSFAQADLQSGPGTRWWTDGWDGYPAARQRLLQSMVTTDLKNPVVIGGDIHAFSVANIKLDFDDPRSPVIASEVCGTSITSQGPVAARSAQLTAENPHILFHDGERRGYTLMNVSAGRIEVDLKVVSDVTDRRATISSLRKYVIEAGRPGPQAA